MENINQDDKDNKKSSPVGSRRFVIFAAAVSALGGLLFGYDTGVISGAILFIRQEFQLSNAQVEVIVSSVLWGAVIGAAFGGWLADRFGRRRMLLVAAVVFFLGAIGSALAPSPGWLIGFRVGVGVAIGMASFAAPLYISEISPARIRGWMVSLNQLAITTGIVVAYIADYALAYAGAWRWMLALAFIPSILLGVGLLLLPDSPRWLMSRGRGDRAHAVLKKIRATSDVGGELSEIRDSLRHEQGGWRELLVPRLRPALIVGVGLAVFQQVTGINTVIYYAPTIFQFAGFQSASAAILATMGVGFVNVLMTLVAMRLLDRVGRRPLLLYGIAVMVVALFVLGLAFLLPALSGALGWLAVASLTVYVGAFAIGLGPVFWLMIAEIYPLRIRGRAMSLATVVNWASNLVVALTFLTLTELLSRTGAFWFFGLVGIASWFFTWRRVPETKGKTLEQIEAQWQSGPRPPEVGGPKVSY